MRRLIQLVVLILLLVHLGGPLFETVDHWDRFAQGGDDFVLSILGVIADFGLTLLVAYFLRWVFLASLANCQEKTAQPSLGAVSQAANEFLEAAPPAPHTSPPLPLRV